MNSAISSPPPRPFPARTLVHRAYFIVLPPPPVYRHFPPITHLRIERKSLVHSRLQQ